MPYRRIVSSLRARFLILRYILDLPHFLTFLLRFPIRYLKLKKIIKQQLKRGKKVIAISLSRKIGDIVAIEPIVRGIRKKYPEEYIIWFTEFQYEAIIVNNPNINSVFGIHCLSDWITFSYLIKFDIICDFHFDGRKCCFLTLKKKVGNKHINHSNYYNHGNLLNIYSKTSSFSPLINHPKFYNNKKDIEIVNKIELPSYYFVVHCETQSKQRSWGSNKWVHLIDYITSELQIDVIEIGNKSDLNIFNNLKYENYCGQLSILSAGELIKRSSMFIGLDSGPAHIANAVGTYGIILMGDYYQFKNYQPFSGGYMTGHNATIIRSKGQVSSISTENVKNCLKNIIQKQNTNSNLVFH